MFNKVHFSSKDMKYETPQEFFDGLNEEFNFTLDPCCVPQTAKCDKYFTPEDDGLKKSWGDNIVFMNPPYGREIKKWVKKAKEEAERESTVVGLIPARTDTRYWHNHIFPYAKEVRFIKGRLKFGNSENSAPFPSAVVVWSPGEHELEVSTMKRDGRK
jgi:site-specific DNA-methyltransferase (adenine-specific)